jgi:predicted dehydrogenase
MTASKVSNLVRFAVIGCGRVVHELHLPAWKQVPTAKLVAACDSSAEAIAEMTRLQPGIRGYSHVEELLGQRDELDFVVLATPGGSHRGLGEQILAEKVHLLCEKPLALEAAVAERLFAAAEANNILLTPIHNYRFKNNSLAALRCVRAGQIGDIVSVYLRFHTGSLFEEQSAWRRKEREHRILLFDFAYHFVDIGLLFLGPIASLQFVDSEVDDLGLRYVVFGTLHKNGARGLFELILDSSCSRTEIEVLGEDRGLVLEFFPDGFRLLPRRDTPLHRAIGDLRRVAVYAKGRLGERVLGAAPHKSIPHARLFNAFVDAVTSGRRNPVEKHSALQTISLLEEVARRAYVGSVAEELEPARVRAEIAPLL